MTEHEIATNERFEAMSGDALLEVVYEYRRQMREWLDLLKNMATHSYVDDDGVTVMGFQQGADRPIRLAIQEILGLDEYGEPVR